MSRYAPEPPRQRPWVKICGVTRPEDAATAAALGATMIGVNFWPRSPRFVGDAGRAREIAAAARESALVAGVFVNEDPRRIEELVGTCALDLVQLHGDEPDEVVAHFAPRAIRALRAEGATRDLSVQDQDQDQDQDERRSVEGKDSRRASVGAGAWPPGRADVLSGGEGALLPPPVAGIGGDLAESPLAPAPGCFPLQWKTLWSGGDSADRQPGFEQKVFCWLLDGPAGARFGGAGAAWDWALARPVVEAAAAPVMVAGGIRPDNVRRALAASAAAGVDVASGVESAPGIKDRNLLERLFEEVARVRA